MDALKSRQKGFTIIEVVLVLAIAGLIFLMVFIALPALQGSQRDSQRRQDLSRLTSQLASYQSNNGGKVPTATGSTSVANFVSGYMRVNGEAFTDPNGDDYVVSYHSNLGDVPANVGDIYYYSSTSGAKCDGESVVAGGGARKVAFKTKLERGGYACQNN